MESQVCVNCRNEKTVNSTTNRLVTENCGHVKCMDCLVQEKNGCLACLSAKIQESNGNGLQLDDKHSDENQPIQAQDKHVNDDSRPNSEPSEYEDLSKRKKPETSHIKVETDANGRCYVCTLCDKKFHARSQVAYHAYCNGQRKPYQCLECYKSFATHSHYKYHMRVHRNERTYSCDVCGDSFFQMSKLQRHKLKHTKEKNYICSVCNKAFNNVSSLRKHSLTHSEERPYQCGVCDRAFRDGSNYRKHQAKHANHGAEKKCTCGSCGSGGGRCTGGGGTGRGGARQLRRHQCQHCPQAFHSSKDMRRHAAVHTDTKPFRCKVCKRRFRRKDNLERHIRNTHPDFVTSSAVECDETALKEIITNGQPENEKTKLEILNPLPPLPEEVMQKHMHGNESDAEIDKSYILVANNARQSVIVGKWTAKVEKEPVSPPECEYVHKIRKANSMASHNNIPLPPIDETKMLELNKKSSLDAFEVGAPPKDKKKVYEMIMYDDADKREADGDSAVEPSDSHWKRRKMKLNMN
ncbi:zinc finger protein 239 [Manduca sexta]|uniref:zinc finger protein 239 n=1 Tax=Manduca sexta TaxID=7130 RepID=UPI00188DD88C|nr:zinc finger protein 239 [Manduca sexta]